MPSFLEIDSGKCMRKKKIISTSGAGSVFLVDIVDQQLSAMYKTNQAIAKIADGMVLSCLLKMNVSIFDRFLRSQWCGSAP